MKMHKGKLFSLICTCVLIFSMAITQPLAIAAATSETKVGREHVVFADRIQELKDKEQNDKVSADNFTTKSLLDFAGNEYTLVECEPSGYLIFHNASGVFVESSLESPSPYKDYDENIYYNGPLGYYVEKDGELVHTITQGVIVKPISTLTAEASSINETLLQQKDNQVLDFVNFGIPMNSEIRASGDTYVEDYTVIRDLVKEEEMGYKNGGLCGYIAGGMAILHLQAHSGLKLIPSGYLTETGLKFNGSGFTEYLRNTYGVTNATTASSLAIVLNTYFNAKKYIVSASHGALASGNQIKDSINNNQTMMLGGQFYSDPDDTSSEQVFHFILAYGYNNTEFIVHYGWGDCSQVRVNNAVLILQSLNYVKLNITP